MKRTVFVLGAGASAVYGFPTGKGLCEAVCEELHYGHPHGKVFQDYGLFSTKEIDSFRTELLNSAQSSVDAFLEHRTEFIHVGKAAIAFMLVRKESPRQLWDFSDQNWLKHLFNKLDLFALSNMHKVPVSFIPFNYDRSLEHFLHTVLQSRYKKTSEESAAILQRIPIIHTYMGAWAICLGNIKGKTAVRTSR
jgi:hypothetical protein